MLNGQADIRSFIREFGEQTAPGQEEFVSKLDVIFPTITSLGEWVRQTVAVAVETDGRLALLLVRMQQGLFYMNPPAKRSAKMVKKNTKFTGANLGKRHCGSLYCTLGRIA